MENDYADGPFGVLKRRPRCCKTSSVQRFLCFFSRLTLPASRAALHSHDAGRKEPARSSKSPRSREEHSPPNWFPKLRHWSVSTVSAKATLALLRWFPGRDHLLGCGLAWRS